MVIFKALQGKITIKNHGNIIALVKYLSSSLPPHFQQSWCCTNTVLKCSFCPCSFLSTGHSFQMFIWLQKHPYDVHRPASLFSFKKYPKSWNDLCHFCHTLWLSCCILVAFAVKNSWLVHSFRKKKEKSFMCSWQYFVVQHTHNKIFYRWWIVYYHKY